MLLCFTLKYIIIMLDNFLIDTFDCLYKKKLILRQKKQQYYRQPNSAGLTVTVPSFGNLKLNQIKTIKNDNVVFIHGLH